MNEPAHDSSSQAPHGSQTGGPADEELLADLADDFAGRLRRGEHPTVEEYASKHPALAERIRKVLPAVAMMEQPRNTEGAVAAGAERPGDAIGRYRLLERIGEGGFGVVYMAEQQQPVRRKVALKVVKPGMDTRQVLARFEAERQALAIMDHPNIAKVFDAGSTDSGRPYFVMELIRGEPITEFCDRNRFSTRQRLELFAQVCHAVQHAHQKGIIHRDIKPTNVLVAMHDTTPVVKVIDFGVAKALGQELTDKTLFTGFAQFLGTPLYMSPEQAGRSSLDVDTRSDIYSLGVLLYELLTGTTPFDKVRFQKAAYDEICRIIREEEPPKPSTRLSDSKGLLPSISAQRHTEPARLTKLIRGELDWIVMKAIEKERARRYETANGLAIDIQRYLNDEIVSARPDSAIYRISKVVKRNRRAFAVTALIAATILLGSFISTWQAIRATRAENEQIHLRAAAEQQREEAMQQRTLAAAAAERERIAGDQERQAKEAAEKARLSATLQLADSYVSRGVAENQVRNGRAALWFANAAVTGHDDPARVEANLIRAKNWSRGHWTPVAAVKQPVETADTMSFCPVNSRYLITTQRLRRKEAPPQIWDLAFEQPLQTPDEIGLLSDATWAPDGRALLGTPIGQLLLVSIPDLQVVQRWDAGSPVRRVAASSNGRFMVAACGKKLLVWDVNGDAQPMTFEHAENIVYVAFSPSGDKIVTATDEDASAYVFSVELNAAVVPHLRLVVGPVPHQYHGEIGGSTDWFIRRPVFVDQSRQLVTIHSLGPGGSIKWYDTASGAELATTNLLITSNRGGPAVSDAGNLLVLAGVRDGTITLVFNAISRRQVASLGNALRYDLSPNGKYLAYSAIDLQVHSVQGDRIGSTVYLGRGGIPAFSRDGEYMAVLQLHGLIQVYKQPQNSGPPIRRPLPLFGLRSWAAFSPDGRYVIPIGRTSGPTTVRTIQVQEPATGNPVGKSLSLDSNLVSADFSPDGELVAAVTWSPEKLGLLRIWNWKTGSLVGEPFQLDTEPVWTCIAPDGKAVAVHCMNGQVYMVDPQSGRQLYQLTCRAARQNLGTYPWTSGRGTIGFSHDGNTLYTWGSPVVQAWDRATGRERWTAQHPLDCWALTESPDGKVIATGNRDGYLRFWDAATGRELQDPFEHPGGILNVDFSPDGRLVATGCDDFKVRVWDVATGNVVRLILPSDYPTGMRFSPDGRFATIALGSGFLVWNCKDNFPLAPVIATSIGGEGPLLDISADGRWGLISSMGSQMFVVDLQQQTEAMNDSPGELLQWAELLSNARVDGSSIVDLTSTEWLERWRQYRRNHPEFRPFENP